MATSRSRVGMLAGLALAVVLPACDGPVESPFEPQLAVWGRAGGEQAFSVYTQNIYLGADTGPLFSLDLTNVPLVIAATNVFWQAVLDSDGPARAAAIVDQIAERRPHLVGLQEVLSFAVLDGSFQPIGGLDFLAEIEAEIASRGLPYETLLVQEATSAALPLAFDPAIPGISRWLAFTDRVVTLRRTDVEVVGTAQGVYAARVPLGPLELERGWTRSSVAHQGTTYHFLTTQLEVQQLAPVQAAQLAELTSSIIVGLEGVTIISGDLNSDAAGAPGDPSWTPTYGELIAADFIDIWHAAPPANRGDGLTCCHPKSLTGDDPLLERIDFVLVRSTNPDAWGDMRGLFRADLVGDEAADLTSSGLWPSDHAGLVASMRGPHSVE